MREEIRRIEPTPLPFGLDDKIFGCGCEEDCDCPLTSYNDFINTIKSISGVNQELLGKI